MSGSTKAFFSNLRKKRIVEILAAFIGGGWLLIEVVERLFVSHYHFPEKTIDITVVTLLCALLCTLIWRWFSGRERPRKFKLELVLIPLVVLVTLLLDINLVLHLEVHESETFPVAKWKNSIAVLPFVDMSPRKDQEYFCDGITEELINRLSNIKELKVPARTSAFFFKGKEQDIREIGRKLDVRTVLEGSVRRAGNELRITAQLINIADGYHLWSQTYDREPQDIFALQDEISLQIINKLKIELLGEVRDRVVKRYTADREAFNFYLQGRYFWEKRGKEDLLRAIAFFNKAIEKDPMYALAYSGIADSYGVLGNNEILPPNETFTKAITAARKALEIDNGLAEAHVSLAGPLWDYDHNFAEAEREYRIAIELNPGYATAHQWFALSLSNLGRHDEAIKEIMQARELDPLSPRINSNVGLILYYARKYDQAIEELKKSGELFPEHAVIYASMGRAYVLAGRYEEAISALNHFLELQPDHGQGYLWLAYCYALSGKREEAQKRLKKAIEDSKKTYVSPTGIARVYLGLGDREQAFNWFNKGFSEKDVELIYLKVDPTFDPLRSDPRFTVLLRKIGFEK